MQEATTNFATNYEMQISRLHDTKASIAEGLAIVVKEIAETGHNPENTLEDIMKLARLFDISAPAPRRAANTLADPRYNLVDYLKRSAGTRTIRELDADAILFDNAPPFTCISQIQDIFEDVSQKISRNFLETASAN